MEVLMALARLAALLFAGGWALQLVIRYVLVPFLDRLIAQAPDAEHEREEPREP